MVLWDNHNKIYVEPYVEIITFNFISLEWDEKLNDMFG